MELSTALLMAFDRADLAVRGLFALKGNSLLIDAVYARERPSEEVIKLLFAFARIEYALKSAGYFQSRQNGDVFADWDRAAGETEELENAARPELAEAISYFYQQPPMVQKVGSRHVQFVTVAGTLHSNVELLKMVRRVRNNLFHGGKVPYRERDERLVRYSLDILRAPLDRNPLIAAHFG